MLEARTTWYLPPRVAFAVLTTMIAQGDDERKHAVARFLRESA